MIKRTLFSPTPVFKNFLAIVRIATGIIILNHGLEVFNAASMEGTIAWIAGEINIPMAGYLVYLAKWVELVGGILLILGLFTRLAALFLFVTMLFIVVVINRFSIFGNGELSFVHLLLYLAIIIEGGGKFSLDHYFFGKR